MPYTQYDIMDMNEQQLTKAYIASKQSDESIYEDKRKLGECLKQVRNKEDELREAAPDSERRSQLVKELEDSRKRLKDIQNHCLEAYGTSKSSELTVKGGEYMKDIEKLGQEMQIRGLSMEVTSQGEQGGNASEDTAQVREKKHVSGEVYSEDEKGHTPTSREEKVAEPTTVYKQEQSKQLSRRDRIRLAVESKFYKGRGGPERSGPEDH